MGQLSWDVSELFHTFCNGRVSMKKLVVAMAVMMLASAVSLGGWAQEKDEEEKKKPKYTIKEVMAKAHKSGLFKKVAAGEATDEEKKELLELYVALAENEPPQGDLEGWKAHTKVLVAAAQAAVDDDEEAGDQILKGANCARCHKVYQPKKK